MKQYDVYCDFDPVKHKEKYINYLEVMILDTGKIEYAVPSHQIKAEHICCQALGISYEELVKRCPEDRYYDYMNWLLEQSKAIAVWNDVYMGEPNERQKTALRRLKLYGIYKGVI